ncbi:peptidase inhibitor family I36 protein [Prauserella rugosa]|uniref:Peptidase inhibitor family I36 n=1 Tax=Prauserella rugosa TaxID=43354 RepID=A0A660C4B0_9PSEU|nr:peptidase inhibitor family I36 protein [Prauserella rugosa]KID29615.1 hypothetical protein HQ32_03029 [Prauserella sp. Am3]KMS92677.1 peptidase inhibitor I36 [Streptomyces regensis]TWH18380.1 peptidase inhibitor family I36 [Prauserella rugosa]
MTRRHIAVRTALPAVLLGVATTIGIATPASAEPNPANSPEFSCNVGEFCAWEGQFYNGPMERFDLRDTHTEKCVPLSNGMEANSFATRMERHVTVYQDRECATEADFSTYPGPGTFVPQAPYVVRAIQIWE